MCVCVCVRACVCVTYSCDVHDLNSSKLACFDMATLKNTEEDKNESNAGKGFIWFNVCVCV